MKRFIHLTCPALGLILSLILLCCPASARNEKYVNLFLGTQGDHGQMAPGAAVPFGMISVCPDSNPRQHGGYDFAIPEISGVSVNRMSGVGCGGGGGNLSILPSSAGKPLSIVKESEKAFPGYYGTAFSNGASGRFTATKDVAVEAFTFAKDDRNLLVDFRSAFVRRSLDGDFKVADGHTVRGWITCGTVCGRGVYKYFYTLRSSKPFHLKEAGKGKAILSFDAPSTEIRIALSSVSPDCADASLEQIATKRFRTLVREARKTWREKLDKIRVRGGDKEQRILFYTSLYRIFLSPMDVTSPDGRYLATDGKIYRTEPGRRHYNGWSMWDTYRTKFPMLFLLEPEVSRDICESLADLYATGKNNWATLSESAPTVRTEHTGIALLDAWNKGIRDFDFGRAWDGMVKEASEDLPRRSLDNLMETSTDLWAMGRIASILGKDSLSRAYMEEAELMFSEVWPEFFMKVTPLFKQMKDTGMYQGPLWQYRWASPQFLDKMIEWCGREKLCAELETFFEDHNFNQGNEPDMHTPFLFNLLGRPDLTGRIVSQLLTRDDMVHVYGGNAEYPEPFVGRAFRNAPDGYAPEMDEDDGAMSAWYMFAQMGFYPVVAGTENYAAFSPLFDRIKIRTGGHTVTIKTRGKRSYRDGDAPVRLLVNGAEIPDFILSHEIFRTGGSIIFEY